MPRTLSAPAGRTQTHSDLDRLQGSWTTIAGRQSARLLVAGSRFAFEFCDGECAVYMGSFVLNGDGPHRHMDMQIDEGPTAHKGQVTLCLYRLEGDILHWCPAKPGSQARPASFPSVDDDKYLSLVFKHVRPQRPVAGGR